MTDGQFFMQFITTEAIISQLKCAKRAGGGMGPTSIAFNILIHNAEVMASGRDWEDWVRFNASSRLQRLIKPLVASGQVQNRKGVYALAS